MDEIEEEERKRRRRLSDPGRARDPARRPDRPGADPRHDRRGPESDRPLARTGGNQARRRRLQDRRDPGSRERKRTGNRDRAGPDPGPGRRRLHAAQLLLLEAGSDPHGEHRARAAAKVPSTAGQPLAKATAALEEAGFEVQVDRVNSAKVAEGLVIHSDPSGGTSATRGIDRRAHRLLGAEAGQGAGRWSAIQAAMAEQQIRAAGFEPSVTEVPDSAPEGQVIRQTPSAGSQIEPGSTVSIVVSEGEETATVPNVIGKLRAGRGHGAARSRAGPDGQRTGNERALQGRQGDRPVPAAGLGSRTGRHGDDRRRQGAAGAKPIEAEE